uniref:Pdd1p n=1 Tax=Tetrahymena thermophila TaxID=5911 RepID=Q94996_TETTH|nr:Pdd1p [Tetrahymena thermophila]AAB61684.1 Pdd1p [Tetrahymena thermophila]
MFTVKSLQQFQAKKAINISIKKMSQKKSLKQKRKQDYSSDTEEEEEDQYEVEKILDSRFNPKTKQKEYLVKWENWPIEDSTWEPYEHLSNVKEIVQAFEKKQKANVMPQPTGPITRVNAQKDPQKKNRLSLNSSISKSLPQEEEIQTSKEDSKKQAVKKFQPASRRKSISSQSDSDLQAEEVPQQPESKKDKNDGAFEEPNNADADETELVFEEIVDKRILDGQTEYLIRFQNVSQPQWVDVGQLIAIKDDVIAYEDKIAAQSQLNKTKNLKENAKHSSQQQQSENNNLETEEVEEDKDSKKRSLLANSKRPTAKRSQPFNQDEEKEKSVTQPTSNLGSKGQSQQVEKEQATNSQTQQPQTAHRSGSRLSQIQSNANQVTQQAQQLSNTNNSSSTSLEVSSKMPSQMSQKRRPIELTEIQQGDFKTDNVDKIEIQGDFNDIMTSRFEVFWKIRQDNVTPASQVYSASYLRRYEPQVLIDFLLQHSNQSQLRQANQQLTH